MNIVEQVYFELGKLNTQIKYEKKAYFLLPMIVRNGVIALNCKSKKIDFATLFSPNVAENPSKETMLIVKYIKTINEFIEKYEFDTDTIKDVLKVFNKDVDEKLLNEFDFSKDLSFLYNVYDCYFDEKNEISVLSISALINIFLVKSKILSLPLLDITKALITCKVTDINDFYVLMLEAIKGVQSIFAEHKMIVKNDLQIAKKANMKSVVLEYNYLLENPVIEVGQMLEDLQMNFATLSKATAILQDNGILVQIAGAQRYRIFMYKNIIDLFEK